MGLLSRADILGMDDRTYQDIKVKEWGGAVRVQSMTGAEREEFENSFMEDAKDGSRKVNRKNILEKLLVVVCVDQEGNRLFSDGDVALLAQKNSAALTRLQTVAQKLNGIGSQELEELEKNSEAAHGGDLSSPLPES